MDTQDDIKLAHLLHSYQVKDAEPEMLESIMAQLDEQKIIKISDYRRSAFVRSISALAASALIGFWFGNATLATGTYYASATSYNSNNATLDDLILTPKSFNEVIL